MKNRVLQWTLLLFFCTAATFGQLPGQQSQKPSIPDENAPNTKTSHHQESTRDVAEKLQKGLDSKNAAYAGSNIRAVVDDQSVTLNGTVTSESQHEMALQLAQAYAGDRKIMDRLTIQQ
jgi:osmotically-inducible protein OsmY